MSIFAGRGEAARRKGTSEDRKGREDVRSLLQEEMDQEHWWKKPVYPWSYIQ